MLPIFCFLTFSAERMWSVIIIALLAAVIVAVLLLFQKKQPASFDERQLRIRGSAFQLAFFVLAGWNLLYLLLLAALGHTCMADGVGALLGILLSTAVFACYCIAKDAFSKGQEKNDKAYLLLLAAVVLSNGTTGVLNLIRGQVVQDGRLTQSVGPLATAVCFLLIGVALLIKRLSRRHEEEDE